MSHNVSRKALAAAAALVAAAAAGIAAGYWTSLAGGVARLFELTSEAAPAMPAAGGRVGGAGAGVGAHGGRSAPGSATLLAAWLKVGAYALLLAAFAWLTRAVPRLAASLRSASRRLGSGGRAAPRAW